eukprot:5636370-Ditylum_brightwellii.AAC.1
MLCCRVSSTGPALWFVVAHQLDTYRWVTGWIPIRLPIWDSGCHMDTQWGTWIVWRNNSCLEMTWAV